MKLMTRATNRTAPRTMLATTPLLYLSACDTLVDFEGLEGIADVNVGEADDTPLKEEPLKVTDLIVDESLVEEKPGIDVVAVTVEEYKESVVAGELATVARKFEVVVSTMDENEAGSTLVVGVKAIAILSIHSSSHLFSTWKEKSQVLRSL